MNNEVTISFFRGSGMFYTVRRMMQFVSNLESKGYGVHVYVDPMRSLYGDVLNEPYKSIGNVWEYFFVNKITHSNINIDSPLKLKLLPTLGKRVFSPTDFINKYMSLQPWVLKSPLVENDAVGIHIRRGDALGRSPVLPCRFYWDKIDALSGSNRIFLATDSGIVADAFKKRYSDRVVVPDNLRYKPGFCKSFHSTFRGFGGELGRQSVSDYMNLKSCSIVLYTPSSMATILKYTNTCIPLCEESHATKEVLKAQIGHTKYYSILEDYIEKSNAMTLLDVLDLMSRFWGGQ